MNKQQIISLFLIPMLLLGQVPRLSALDASSNRDPETRTDQYLVEYQSSVPLQQLLSAVDTFRQKQMNPELLEEIQVCAIEATPEQIKFLMNQKEEHNRIKRIISNEPIQIQGVFFPTHNEQTTVRRLRTKTRSNKSSQTEVTLFQNNPWNADPFRISSGELLREIQTALFLNRSVSTLIQRRPKQQMKPQVRKQIKGEGLVLQAHADETLTLREYGVQNRPSVSLDIQKIQQQIPPSEQLRGTRAQSLLQGMRMIARLTRIAEEGNRVDGTLGIVSSERFSGVSKNLIASSLGYLARMDIESMFLSGKPLSKLNLKEEMKNTDVNYSSNEYQQVKQAYQSINRTTADRIRRTAGKIFVGLGYVGAAIAVISTAGAIIAGPVALIAGTESMAGTLMLITMISTGSAMASTAFGTYLKQAREEQDVDMGIINKQGLAVYQQPEIRGVIPDGINGPNDDQNLWNPADWFDGKTNAHPHITDAFTRHAYLILHAVENFWKRTVESREQQRKQSISSIERK